MAKFIPTIRPFCILSIIFLVLFFKGNHKKSPIELWGGVWGIVFWGSLPFQDLFQLLQVSQHGGRVFLKSLICYIRQAVYGENDLAAFVIL